MAVYLFIDRIVFPVIFHIENSPFFNDVIQWGKVPLRENIFNIVVFGYTITIGHTPLVNVVNPIIATYARKGIQTAYDISNLLGIPGNVLLLPVAVLFLAKVISVMRKKIPPGRRLLYMLAGIGVPLCIMLLAIIGGNRT